MKYQGSKAKIRQDILMYILMDRQPGQWFVEPFVGGANITSLVVGNRLASDNNEFLISLFKALQQGWEPPNYVSKKDYTDAKEQLDGFEPLILEEKALIGFIGFGCSFASKWFGGYARGEGRNYADECRRSLLEQKKSLEGVVFKYCDYRDLEIPANSIIYCDPPYEATTAYHDEFSHARFWAWAEKMSYSHKVFVLEYKAPETWKCIWAGVVSSSLDKDTGSKNAIEKLFIRNL